MQTKRFTIKYKQEGSRLVDVIAAELDISKKQAKTYMDAKQVFLNKKRIWMAKHAVMEGDDIEVIIETPPSVFAPKKVAILWQDDQFLIINKPPFTLTNADPNSIEATLQKQENNPKICAVHRLDKETSGCLLFAKNNEAKELAIPMFKERKIIKVYRAVTVGKFSKSWTEIHTDIDGFMSTTLVKTLDANKQASYLELRIETGRTHQIRRHLADKRYPVLGDKKYAGTSHTISVIQPRQMLHAYRLIFPHPKSGEIIRATAPIPADFKKCLTQLKLR